MPRKLTYLVRSPDGKMRTVIAHSGRGALKIYITRFQPKEDGYYDVKPRGEGTWETFKFSR